MSEDRISKAALVIREVQKENKFLRKMVEDILESQRTLRAENKQLRKEFEQTKDYFKELMNAQNDSFWFYVRNVNELLRDADVAAIENLDTLNPFADARMRKAGRL